MRPALLLASGSSIFTAAKPILRRAGLQNFLLVTTSQCPPANSSALLANVSATSLFDPYTQPDFYLRLIQPGYNSLPTFNLTNGDLHTVAEGIDADGFGNHVYNSTGTVEDGEELIFDASTEPNGNLGLKNGYLLTVGGEEWGWTICEGPLSEDVVGFL